MSWTETYQNYLDNIGGARQQTTDLFGQLLTGNRQARQDVADRYSIMGQQLADMSRTASDQTMAGYGAARNRVQASPAAYSRPEVQSFQVGAVPMVGADQATVANLQAAAQQNVAADQAALERVYGLLSQSEAANRSSRLSDIDIAQTSDLAALSALAQAQQFGMGAAQSRELNQIDALINQALRDQIATSLGFDQQELAAVMGMAQAQRDAETFAFNQAEAERAARQFEQTFGFNQAEAERAARQFEQTFGFNQEQAERAAQQFQFDIGEAEASASRAEQTFDQNALNSSVNMFTAMIDPIVDSLDPQSVIELWLAFSEEIGMPMNQALGAVGAV